MPENATCPFCSATLSEVFLYVRGIGAALFRSGRSDVALLSRADLQQINLSKISQTGTGAQAVIRAWHCDNCDSLSFKAS